MANNTLIQEFLDHLKNKKGLAENSRLAYESDISDFVSFLESSGLASPVDATEADIVAYSAQMKKSGKAASTINRKMTSIRTFFRFLSMSDKIKNNPAASIKAPKVERKKIEYLTVEEVNRLLETPGKNIKGLRDRAILEIMYATGVRVNELVAANLDDINLRIGFFTCKGDSGRARIVPIGSYAKEAVENYLENARDMMVKNDRSETALFVNFTGGRMSRQGLWKMLKGYGEKAGLGDRLTPHVLRNSFAVHMVQNGADLKSLKDLMGHEDPTATQIYFSITNNRIKDVYDRTHPRA